MRRVVAMLLLCCALAPAQAAVRVYVMLSEDAPAYRAVAAALEAGLPDAGVSVGFVDAPVPAEAALIVSVGTRASERAIAAGGARPVFATLVPAATWRQLAADAGPVPATALYLDQPVRRHAALVRALLPPVRELGVVLGPASAGLASELQSAAAGFSIRIHRSDITSPDAVGDAVVAVLQRSEALLAVPDPVVYNRYSVRAVLLATFRLRRPVVGFSEAWVRAGALGAAHSTPDQLGTELASMVDAWLAVRGPLPQARHPESYTVTVNRQVAFSLGIYLPTDAALLERVRALEASP